MSEYNWKFSTIGGKTRVNIVSGEDIRHLGELDQKLWTVLSCPVTGLEFNEKTLKMLDANGDGRIHVNEVVSAANWLTSIIDDPDLLLKKEDFIRFSSFNTENPDGKRLLASAKQILSNLGLKKDSISIADTDDSVAIFAKTAFNGDGIITEQSTPDEELKDTINKCISSMGSKTDRSGLEGVDVEIVESFYEALSAYAAWMKKADDDKKTVFPYGEKTAEAFETVNAIKAKVSDYFMRCKLAAFSKESAAALDVSASRIETISDKDLSECDEIISQYPLAGITADGTLPIDERVNPVWQSTISKLKALVFDKDFKGAKEITEEQWKSVIAKFGAYEAWLNEKAGSRVEALGIDEVKAILKSDRKPDLLKLIDEDKALEQEAASIDEVNKLLHLYRDFYTFLCNFVSFKDFYNPEEKAIFQAGKLYIDERCCKLCIKVNDMKPHNASAGLSGMFIVYCNCINKISSDTMIIAAVITNGDISDLREGKNGLFYDRHGGVWDATVFKIIDNPISISQAFWSPYRKLGRFIENTVQKSAAEKDEKAVGELTAKVTGSPEEKKQMFDIGKFAGIFAALSLAVGALTMALAKIIEKVAVFHFWQWLVLIAVIMLAISGPAMILAWLKLRKRNLAPLLNANGWAINAAVKVNITFGSTLTEVSSAPLVADPDPFADKAPLWKKILKWLILLCAVFAVFYYTNLLYLITKSEKLHYIKDKSAVEVPVKIPVEAPAENAESMLVIAPTDLGA